jgi:glucose/arabinose dehydrogenase
MAVPKFLRWPQMIVGVALLATALIQCSRVTSPQPTGPPGSHATVEIVARGLETPWALAFASDGRLFVTERPGRIRLMAGGRLQRKPIAVLKVVERDSSGLMGLALDPRFDDNGFLYVCYTADIGGGRGVNRLGRLTFRDGVAAHEVVLLERLPAGVHNGCRVKFGPDGKLYLTVGDAGVPELAQRIDSLGGKILRLNADGSVPADNPFPGSPVYSFGNRNPQGLAWDRQGRLIEAEHGPTGHDEINYIRAGANYGWPRVRGKAGDSRYADPLIESGEDETWAPSGIAIRDNDLFVAGLRGQQLFRMTIGPDLEITRTGSLLDQAFGRLRDVVVGPDGALYVTTSNRDGTTTDIDDDDDRILRVTSPDDVAARSAQTPPRE